MKILSFIISGFVVSNITYVEDDDPTLEKSLDYKPTLTAQISTLERMRDAIQNADRHRKEALKLEQEFVITHLEHNPKSSFFIKNANHHRKIEKNEKLKAKQLFEEFLCPETNLSRLK